MSQSLVEVTDLSAVKAGGCPTMRACVQVPSMTSEKLCLMETLGKNHTWPEWCRAAPRVFSPRCCSSQLQQSIVVRRSPFFREDIPAGRTKGRNVSTQ